ncbi:MAG: sugar ABC transporter substrate-binding protein, partial [Candidatus Contubernalis sp.]|nr:sugar ABC transporter substrate-binding protein [Candidatus Contubernalis sp.]
MKREKPTVKTFFVLILVLSVCAGCIRKQEPSIKKVRLTYAMWENLPVQVKTNKEVVDRFNKTHPGIEVKMEQSTIDKILIQIGAKCAPDIFFWQGFRIPELAEKNTILPLDNFIKEDSNFNIADYFRVSLVPAHYKGKLYLFPTHTDFALLYYNKSLFDKYNVKYPGVDLTWDKLVPLAQKFTHDINGDGRIDIFGINVDTRLVEIMLCQKGLSHFNPEGTKINFNDPAFIDILQYLKDMRDKYKVAPSISEMESIGNQDVMFETGRLAMAILGSWMIPAYSEKIKNFEWDVSYIPRYPGSKKGFCYLSQGNCISSSTKHPKEAWEFVKFFSGPNGRPSTVMIRNSLPPLKSA